MFDLRSLEGVFIVFAGPCLVDSFGRTSIARASFELEAHWMDTMAMMTVFGGLREILDDLT
jgi:hypothetical protein